MGSNGLDLLPGLIGLLLVAVVITLVAWALNLMQSASDSNEFSLMLAGCLVCSAAVGLSSAVVIALAGPSAPLVHIFHAG